jgi:hypothetical protein
LWQLASLNGLEDALVVFGENPTVIGNADDDLGFVLDLKLHRDTLSHLMVVLCDTGLVLSYGVCNLVEDVNVEDLVLVVNSHFTDHYVANVVRFKLKTQDHLPESQFFTVIVLAGCSDIRTIIRIEWVCPGAITHPTRITFYGKFPFFIDFFGKV